MASEDMNLEGYFMIFLCSYFGQGFSAIYRD